MRAVAFVALALVGPAYAVAACGGDQGAPPSAPVVQTPTASVAPVTAASEPPPRESTPEEKPEANERAPDDATGASSGLGGVGLAGTGGGAGIGLGNVGTLGHGHGGFTSRSSAPPPSVRQGATTVSSGLPPEVIQRIVRQNFGRFRFCYENALRNNPTLAGRLTVSFTIDATGAVQKAHENGATIGDKALIACVVRGFANLSFPAPSTRADVNVSYPLIFAPSEQAPPAPAPAKPKPAPSK